MLLLVDDDPKSLERSESVLKAEVLFARTAEQAFFLLDNLAEDISVALVKVDLPGESGGPLIDKMLNQYPNLPVIGVTGALYQNLADRATALALLDALTSRLRSGSRSRANSRN